MRIGLVDIETAPVMASVWKLWDENVSLDQIVKDWYILAFSFKWLGEKHIYYKDKSKTWRTEDDLPLLKDLWELLDEADVVVAQNGRQFDIKKINARFILNGLKPPSPFKIVDTQEIAKRHFGFTSNKLAYMTDKLCKTKKLVHNKFPGYLLWQQCLQGNQKAWKEMERYNKIDVLSLEELYYIMLPWINDHPNYGLYTDGERCNRCNSTKLVKHGIYKTAISTYQRYQCKSCGGWLRGRKATPHKQLLIGV